MTRWMRFPLDDREAWKDESHGPLRDAVRLAREGEPRPPTEDDRPSPRPFPGTRRKPIPGQLSLFDGDEPGLSA